MDLDRAQGLAFLLSLAAVPMAGCPASTEDTTSGGTGDTTGDSQTSDPSTDPSTVSITTTDPTDASASMSTTVDPTTDPSTDPSTLTDPTDATTEGTTTDPTDPTDATGTEETTTNPSTDEGTTGPADPLCTEFADHIVECFPMYAGAEDYLTGYCNDSLQYYAAYSPECGTAGEEFFACLAMADCGDLEGEDPCPDEAAAVAAACGDIGSSSSSGGN